MYGNLKSNKEEIIDCWNLRILDILGIREVLIPEISYAKHTRP